MTKEPTVLQYRGLLKTEQGGDTMEVHVLFTEGVALKVVAIVAFILFSRR